MYFCAIPILKSTPSQINLMKNAQNSKFIIENIKKYRKCPALNSLWKLCLIDRAAVQTLRLSE